MESSIKFFSTASFEVTGYVKALTYGSFVPTNIIDTAKDWQVVVEWRTTGADSARFAGSWELNVAVEVLGPGSDFDLGKSTVNLRPGPSPIDYGPIAFRVEAQLVPVGTYRLQTVIQYIDAAGQRGNIVGIAEEGILQVYDSGVPASDVPDPEAIRRAENISVLRALENSKVTWNSIDDLSKETRLAPEKIAEIIDRLGEHIMKETVPSKEGRILYATRGRVRRQQRNLHRELDARTAAQQAITTGTGVDIHSDTAYERIVGSTTSVVSQLESNYRQTREQANNQHRLSLVAGGIGVLLISIGVIALIGGYVAAGVVTTIVSVVFDTIATFFFLEARKANSRVDQITKKLTDARELYTLVEIADSMEDQKSRNELKAEIIQKILSQPDSRQ